MAGSRNLERSEGDDVGLRVLVGQRQAVVSTNDMSGDGIAKLAERAVAMARVAPDDKYVGLADPSLLARDFPDLDLLDPEMPSTAELERRAQETEAAALAVKGVSKSGGASASAGNRRHGAGHQHRLPRLLSALEPRRLDDGDIGRRHRHRA